MLTQTQKIKKSVVFTAFVLFLAVFTALPALASDAEAITALRHMGDAFASIAEQASPAVVGIKAEREVQSRDMQQYFNSPFEDEFFERFFGMPRDRMQERQQRRPRTQAVQGTGFIISEDGYILTNNHLVENAVDDEVKVSLNDSKTLTAKVVGADPASDVAVVKIDADDLPYLELADSSELKVGQWVVAIGNPFGLSHTVTAGIVSAKGRNSLALEDVSVQDFIQTDAAINPGNSGGPLLNLDGEVVGINSAILGVSGNVGIGFAIPTNMAKSIADQLIEHGKVTRGFLGIHMEPISDDLAQALNLEDNQGALVKDVGEDTPAEKAGLERYDVIIEVNGDPIKNYSALHNKIAGYQPGTEVELTIIRDGRTMTLDVTLGERDPKALALLSGGSEVVDKLGFEVANLSDDVVETFGLDEDLKGVIIASVEADSEAAEKGLQRGMVITEVNRKPVRNDKEFNELVEDAVSAGKKTLLLYVVKGSRDAMVILHLPEE